MKAAIASLALVVAAPALAQPTTVQIPAPDPELPRGGLAFVGATAVGAVYADFSGFERSDVSGMVLGPLVLTRTKETAPLQVARVWIDCGKDQFQLDAGRLYDAGGAEVGRSPFMQNQPVPKGSPVADLARVVCGSDPASWPGAFSDVADWRAALARAKQ